MYNFPLFLPSVVTTSADYHNKLTDSGERRKQVIQALNKIIDKGIFKEIVIVDGSNTEILSEDDICAIKSKGVIVEQLLFQQNKNEVLKYGKGQGEMQITNYMVENSKLVNRAGGFYKLTSRYFIENLKDIIKEVEDKKNVFFYNHAPLVRNFKRFVCTIFYKVDVDFYKKNIMVNSDMHSKEVNGLYEAVFFRSINSINKKPVYLNYPIFSGVSGTSGTKITNRLYSYRNFFSPKGMMCYSFEDYDQKD